MKRIDPTSFVGPRAYFTTFDYRIVARKRDRSRLRLDVERKLKILLLTKAHIVCAASHLTSPFAFNFFRDNPVLLNSGAVTPALRTDKPDIAAVFEKVKIPQGKKAEMVAFFEDNIVQCVNWDFADNAQWFRDSFLRELTTPQSVMRRQLAKLPAGELESLIGEVQREPTLGRDQIDDASRAFPRKERRVVITFRELLYHISGARVVHCESTLPQENYVDYSLADMKKGEVILSEQKVFWKIFCELAFETLYKAVLPLEILDGVSFDEILQLRQPLTEGLFMDEYDRMVEKAIAGARTEKPEGFLHDLNELLGMREALAKAFDSTFEKELRVLLRVKRNARDAELAKNTVSIASGLAGHVVPLLALPELAMQARELCFNLNQTFKTPQSLRDYDAALVKKQETLRSILRESRILPEAPLLDTARQLAELLRRKYEF